MLKIYNNLSLSRQQEVKCLSDVVKWLPDSLECDFNEAAGASSMCGGQTQKWHSQDRSSARRRSLRRSKFAFVFAHPDNIWTPLRLMSTELRDVKEKGACRDLGNTASRHRSKTLRSAKSVNENSESSSKEVLHRLGHHHNQHGYLMVA